MKNKNKERRHFLYLTSAHTPSSTILIRRFDSASNGYHWVAAKEQHERMRDAVVTRIAYTDVTGQAQLFFMFLFGKEGEWVEGTSTSSTKQ
jgi:hypothetical protein